VVDLELPAFSVIALCQARFLVSIASGTPCEIRYRGSPEGLSADVRLFPVGQSWANAGDSAAVLLGFLDASAHRPLLQREAEVEFLRGQQLVGTGKALFVGTRSPGE